MNNHIENRLWAAANQLWANSPLKPSDYSEPVLGLIFLKYADFKSKHVAAEISAKYKTSSRREPSKLDYQSKIGLSIPEKARFSYLKTLPEGADIGKAINDAMKRGNGKETIPASPIHFVEYSQGPEPDHWGEGPPTPLPPPAPARPSGRPGIPIVRRQMQSIQHVRQGGYPPPPPIPGGGEVPLRKNYGLGGGTPHPPPHL